MTSLHVMVYFHTLPPQFWRELVLICCFVVVSSLETSRGLFTIYIQGCCIGSVSILCQFYDCPSANAVIAQVVDNIYWHLSTAIQEILNHMNAS